MSLSEYFQTLEGAVRERYVEKISAIRNLDPYFLKTGFSDKIEDMPPITSNHIQEYLVNTVSSYTFRSFMAFKSLYAEDYLASDKVAKLESRRIGDKFIIRANVAPSMRSSEPCRLAWAVCCTAGIVESAHCTCMAGLAEGCSHVGAVLFAVMHLREQAPLSSVTDKAAYWKLPSKRLDVSMASVKNIDFDTPKNIIKRRKKGLQKQRTKHLKVYPEPSNDEFQEVLQEIMDSGTLVSTHLVTSPFNEKCLSNNSNMPSSLLELYSPENENKSLEELQAMGRQIDLSVTPEVAELINLKTKGQSKCRQWYKQRAGKIPASLSQKAFVMDIEDPAISTIRAIVYPYENRFTSKATKYGCEHEELAFRDYASKMTSEHINFTCDESGYTVHSQYPECGATPDGKTNCSCCGKGCLEIKCPFCMEKFTQGQLQEALEKNLAKHCLQQTLCETTGHLCYSLKKNHPYYFQVQQQMFLCDVQFCDFVLWTGKVFIRTRVPRDEAFWSDVYAENKKKFYDVLMPEILGKYFTRLHAEKKKISAQKEEQITPRGVSKKKRKPRSKPSHSMENDITKEFFKPGQQVTNIEPRKVLGTIQRPGHHHALNQGQGPKMMVGSPLKVVHIGKLQPRSSPKITPPSALRVNIINNGLSDEKKTPRNAASVTPVRVFKIIDSPAPFASDKSTPLKVPVKPRSSFYQRLLDIPYSPR